MRVHLFVKSRHRRIVYTKDKYFYKRKTDGFHRPIYLFLNFNTRVRIERRSALVTQPMVAFLGLCFALWARNAVRRWSAKLRFALGGATFRLSATTAVEA